jgi:Tol biopolymer transport system component
MPHWNANSCKETATLMRKQAAILGWLLAGTLIATAAVAGLMLGAGTAPALVPAATATLPNTPMARPVASDEPQPLPPLIFARDGQIWQSDGSAAPPRRLTRLPQGEAASQPALSPDGAQIAFVTLVQPPITATVALPSSRLYVLDRDSGALRQVWQPDSGILWLPSWTHDGSALLVLANGTAGISSDDQTGRQQIVRVDLTSASRTTVVRGALDPTVSPDGAQLAYLAFDRDGIHLHVELAAIDGSSPRRLIDGSQFQGFFAPRFSPDGSQIVVAGLEGPPTDDQGYPLATTPPGPLNTMLGLFAPPVAEAHGAPWDVWIVNVDGGGLRRIAHIADDMPMATFSPDGSEIVVMAYNGFYRLNHNGTRLRRIDSHGDHGGLAWDTRP